MNNDSKSSRSLSNTEPGSSGRQESTNERKRKSRWSQGPEGQKDSKLKIQAVGDECSDSVPERAGFGFASVKPEPSLSLKLIPEVKQEKSIVFTKATTSVAPESSDVTCDKGGGDFMDQIRLATERAKKIAQQVGARSVGPSEALKAISSLNAADPMAGMSDEQKKQYIEQKELQVIFDNMMAKRRELEQISTKAKFKRDYDSDEECEDGTWEHKLRSAEQDATKEWAMKLTEMAKGKHHIGDFLPPDELNKFMETYQALKDGRTPDHSDYKEFKINAENLGFKLLQKLGWQEGQGLGKANQGIVDPVNKGNTSFDNTGVGVESGTGLKQNDSEFEMYRKRMMLAYKFRPNPLNNPRRPYY